MIAPIKPVLDSPNWRLLDRSGYGNNKNGISGSEGAVLLVE